MKLHKMNLEFEQAKEMCLKDPSLCMRRMDGKHKKTKYLSGLYVPKKKERVLFRFYHNPQKEPKVAVLRGGQHEPWETYIL